jgi:hypothetical protein
VERLFEAAFRGGDAVGLCGADPWSAADALVGLLRIRQDFRLAREAGPGEAWEIAST